MVEVDISANSRLDQYRKIMPSTPNPVIVIWSPRNIPEVREAHDKIDYVDKVWFKYFNKPSVLAATKKWFDKRLEYTHLIVVLDDVVCPPESVKILLEDLTIYDFPVLSGCFNFCNMWMSGVGYCTHCENNEPHEYINITFDPIPQEHLNAQNLTRQSYKFISEKWRRANPVIRQIWFHGFPLGVIRRDIYEKVGFKTWNKNWLSTDIPWAVDLAQRGIPQFCDFSVKLHHLCRLRDKTMFVGVRPTQIIFEPAKRPLSEVIALKLGNPEKRQITRMTGATKEYLEYRDFLKELQKYSVSIPPRPSKTGTTFDKFSKQIINQGQWDAQYGKHRKFIEGYIPEELKYETVNVPFYKLPKREKEHLNILIAVDQYGWAFDFGARGIKKYSKHSVMIERADRIRPCDIIDSNILFCMCSGQWYSVTHFPPNTDAINKTRPKIVVGLRAGPDEAGEHIPRNIPAHALACISKETYDYTKKLEKRFGTNRPAYLTYSATDHEIFTPIAPNPDRFVVGWVGYKGRPVKRANLLSKIKFPIKTREDHGPQFFVYGRSQQPMADFYHTIDAYICLSSSEGLPQTILEALASGLPIVSTAVGAIPEIIDEEWLVPVNPINQMINQMNEKLQILKDDFELRKKIGEQNRQKSLRCWCWKEVVKNYDSMFEEII